MSTYWEPSLLMVRDKNVNFCQKFLDDKKVFWLSIQDQDCLGSPREIYRPAQSSSLVLGIEKVYDEIDPR